MVMNPIPNNVWLIHGWAANHHVFEPLVPYLPTHWQQSLIMPDLPGHGSAPFAGVFDVVAVADELALQISTPAHVLGWSLGGLVSLYLAARHPHKVKTLCLTASFARFLAAPDYPEGLANPALDKMLALFGQDYHKYMRQFMELQFLYAPKARAHMDEWLPALTQYGTPPALAVALHALTEADARACLGQISCPVLLIFGGKDAITPPRMGEYLQRHLPDATLHVLARAAHAPFVSHSADFAPLLVDFWERYS